MIEKGKLDNAYKEMLEEKIINCLAETKKISIRQAMDIYYHSKLSQQINDESYGIENMDYRYLVNDLIENEPELFERTEYTIQEILDLILDFLDGMGGMLGSDVDQEESARKFVDDGYANIEKDDWYEINQRGLAFLHPYIESINKEIIDFIAKKRNGRTLDEIYKWFAEKYDYKNSQDVEGVVNYLLKNISDNYGYKQLRGSGGKIKLQKD